VQVAAGKVTVGLMSHWPLCPWTRGLYLGNKLVMYDWSHAYNTYCWLLLELVNLLSVVFAVRKKSYTINVVLLMCSAWCIFAFCALILFVELQERHPDCKDVIQLSQQFFWWDMTQCGMTWPNLVGHDPIWGMWSKLEWHWKRDQLGRSGMLVCVTYFQEISRQDLC